MKRLDVDEARPLLADLIAEAAAGEQIVILRHDGVAVRLEPVTDAPRPRFGSARGTFMMADDFDAPLEDLSPFER
jgi:antitoxin (DNA-binding transcriptional repressor) of toxin-antitoxin stability system